ncbi:kinetochore-associated protein NSL1 homolog isoform X2 [Anolis carolinensis]|uniref:kinetochore-associated protein NSL1 homolog isoform X2 n=1 Tax=Anolis carolinensis TaxID=28377 RepID=UPI00046258B8|nr:PREDICTED: kinetochore-associated protein NSL1 homolog isoform X2 [Anolis carolinensis]|eukprot:XP_008124038.1 PREDICTED: kinetochore-associated protein NSL1 homolog isoform X2 [Anolis carolinensis]
MAGEMKAAEATSPSACPPCDPRVPCRSRDWTAELLGEYGPLVEKLGAGQAVEAEALKQAVAEAIGNFETAVQENITVNGQPWQESSDDLHNVDMTIKLLEDKLDDLIVEVASKRSRYPREVKIHVIKALKTKQKLLDHRQTAGNCQEITSKPSQVYVGSCGKSRRLLKSSVSGANFGTVQSPPRNCLCLRREKRDQNQCQRPRITSGSHTPTNCY